MIKFLLCLLSRNLDKNRKQWPARKEEITSLSGEGPTRQAPQKQTELKHDHQSEKPISEDDSPQDHNDEQVVVLDNPKLGRRVIRMRTIASLRLPKKTD